MHLKYSLETCLICLKFFVNKMLLFRLVVVLFYVTFSILYMTFLKHTCIVLLGKLK